MHAHCKIETFEFHFHKFWIAVKLLQLEIFQNLQKLMFQIFWKTFSIKLYDASKYNKTPFVGYISLMISTCPRRFSSSTVPNESFCLLLIWLKFFSFNSRMFFISSLTFYYRLWGGGGTEKTQQKQRAIETDETVLFFVDFFFRLPWLLLLLQWKKKCTGTEQ